MRRPASVMITPLMRNMLVMGSGLIVLMLLFVLMRLKSSTRKNSALFSAGLFDFSGEERVDRPRSMPVLNELAARDPKDLAYHHIIPVGDMQFLWLLGQENSAIKGFLDLWCAPAADSKDEAGRLTINAVAWSPWNLFVGPANRSDDPKRGDHKEAMRPDSFPVNAWSALEGLYEALQMAWRARIVLQSGGSDYRSAFILRLDEANERAVIDPALLIDLRAKRRLSIPESNYLEAQKAVYTALKTLREKVNGRGPGYLHAHQESDWGLTGYDARGIANFHLLATESASAAFRRS